MTVEQNYINLANDVAKTREQQVALDSFKALGLPTKKNEAWKYTNISKALPENVELASQLENIKEENFLKLLRTGENFVVLSNGIYNAKLSRLASGITLSEEATTATKENDAFSQLNSAMTVTTLVLTIEKNAIVEAPIVIYHLHDGANGKNIFSKIQINARAFSNADVIEVFAASDEGEYVSNNVTEIHTESGAKIEHIKAQIESQNAIHIGATNAFVERDANVRTFTFSLGAKIARNNVSVELNQPGACALVNGLYATRNEQHVDNFTQIHHNKEHTESEQLFKGILDDSSRGAFTGKIVVHRDAQQVNSSQLNKNLLLSKKAKVDTRPQLEVYADDVKCAHGATVGQISEEEVFYLESRGIKRERAQKILCHAYASEIIDMISKETVKETLSKLLFENFEQYALEHL